MGNRAERTEHSGAKRGRGAYYGKKRWAKRDSAIRHRQAEGAAIAEQQRDVDPLKRR